MGEEIAFENGRISEFQWAHPFFIHFRTPAGRDVAAFTLAL